MSDAISLTTADLAPRSRVLAYVELSKPRIGVLVLIATALGFALAMERPWIPGDWLVLAATLVGTGLVAAAANTLNQCLEIDFDRQMDRTRNRPLPSGRLSEWEALLFGAVCVVGGLTVLLVATGPTASIVAAVTFALYVFVYTPLKRVTSLCVYVGAVPGALPPVIGWAAADGGIGAQAWLLFAIVFLWQLPHFLAIAWMYRDDYRRGGYPMLTVIDEDGHTTNLHMITHTIALMIVTLMPVQFGMNGALYGAGAMLLGTAFLGFGILFVRHKSLLTARFHLLSSITYLPALLALMTVDKLWLS